MTKTVLYSFAFFLLNLSCRDDSAGGGDIVLKYMGDQDKPIPVCVLSTNKAWHGDPLEYKRVFNIPFKDFEAMKKNISSKYLPQSEHVSKLYYRITLKTEGYLKIFGTSNKRETEGLFLMINDEISEKPLQDSLKSFFATIIKRIP